jgi:hypothetical protein
MKLPKHQKRPEEKGVSFCLGLLFLLFSACSCFATVSLDDILSSLETRGVLVDRSRAVRGGIEGILRSIDPGAFIGVDKAVGDSCKESRVKQAVAGVELWPEDIAYLKIEGLLKGSGPEILEHVRALDSKAGIILDFRGAGGQDLESVSYLAGIGHLSGEPLFVVTDNQDKPISTNRVEAGVSLRAPLMVLVDDRTRLAAEALVAVWRGQPGIMVIGSATSGEIRFREAMTLPDGPLITLTTRKLRLLQGGSYEGCGIRPDVEVGCVVDSGNAMLAATNSPARPLSVKSERDRELMQRVDQDAALRRATDILLGLRVLSGYGQR